MRHSETLAPPPGGNSPRFPENQGTDRCRTGHSQIASAKSALSDADIAFRIYRRHITVCKKVALYLTIRILVRLLEMRGDARLSPTPKRVSALRALPRMESAIQGPRTARSNRDGAGGAVQNITFRHISRLSGR